MFGWFRSKTTCPVDSDEKEWIEQRFSWLTGEFGERRLFDGTHVLPTTEFFADRYHGTDEELTAMMHRVAEYMDVDPSVLNLDYYQDEHPEFEATMGLYTESDGRFDIWLEVTNLEDPLSVVGTLAHEIGHVVLLGQRRISAGEEDHEYLTDLVTVFLGLGIFCANDVIHEEYWHAGQVSGWSIGRQGYLSMDMFGYAFALYALARGESAPQWLQYLRADVRGACKKGIQYITETGDCEFSLAVR